MEKQHLSLVVLSFYLPVLMLALSFTRPAVAAAQADTDDFIITIKTDNAGTSNNNQFTLPTLGSGYDYNIDCDNDGVNKAINQAGDFTCTYPAPGIFTIRIHDNSGAGTGFPRIYFNNGGDRLKLLTVEQWGTEKWTTMNRAFAGCANLTIPAVDVPDLSIVSDLSFMFQFALSFNQPINGWNTSSVTNMSGLFYGAFAFNQDISTWNTSKVTDMSDMFRFTAAFNQPIGEWDTGSVTNMSRMFYNAAGFNQPIGSWNTGSVSDMRSMFHNATLFNQDISAWNTGSVTNMGSMFQNAYTFNQDISAWDTSSVTNMGSMFNGASVFNQLIGGWDTSRVTNLNSMFTNASVFNQPIGNWNTGSVNDMSFMLQNTNAFNQPVGGWNTGSVTSMVGLFYGANAFNQPIGSWDTGRVTDMSFMFYGAGAFNQPIGSWNTINVSNLNAMFQNSPAFNQNLGGWNVTAVTTANDMFTGAGLSIENYDALLIGWDAQSLQYNVTIHGGNSQFCMAETARAHMIRSDSWVFDDGGKNCGIIWDGGGADNNWSTAANWVGDVLPGASDTVHFDATSAKDALIDPGFGGAVAGMSIASGYSGTVSFGRSIVVSGSYKQDGGILTLNPAHTFTVNGSFEHTGGVLQETQIVGSGSNVSFLQIQTSGGANVYRGVDLTTTTSNLGSVMVAIRAVDRLSQFCTSSGSGSPAYSGRCYTISPTNNLPARVTLWIPTSQAPAYPSIYHDKSGWQELANLAAGTAGSYTWVAGDTPGFSSFLIAEGGAGPNTPSPVTLTSLSAASNTPGWTELTTLLVWLAALAVHRICQAAVYAAYVDR